MDHDKATTSYTIERYMLGELPERDRDQFEEHFFDCVECAGHVRSFSILAANAKATFSEPSTQTEVVITRKTKPGWLDGFSLWQLRPAYGLFLCTLVALTSVAAYQAVSLRKQMAPQTVASFVLHPEVRGEETVIDIQRLGAFLLLEADVPNATSDLKWEIRSVESPDPFITGTAKAPEVGASLKVLIPASRLKASHYVLTIRPSLDPDISTLTPEATYRFRID